MDIIVGIAACFLIAIFLTDGYLFYHVPHHIYRNKWWALAPLSGFYGMYLKWKDDRDMRSLK